MKLYVGNLSFQTTEADLRDAFGAHGTVTDTHMIMDRETQRPRGFAFVTMGSQADGQAAINAMHGRDLDGRTLTVNEARPMEERGPRRDFGGGGGDRRSSFRGGGGGGGYRDRR
jgi:RNA recognition motif-containing protein